MANGKAELDQTNEQDGSHVGLAGENDLVSHFYIMYAAMALALESPRDYARHKRNIPETIMRHVDLAVKEVRARQQTPRAKAPVDSVAGHRRYSPNARRSK